MRINVWPLLIACVLGGHAASAWAQRVVVLEIDGDRGHHLREQVERELKRAGKVELVSLKRYKDGAARKHVKGAKAMSPSGVAQVSHVVPFEAAVGGTLADTFFVRILDSTGQELWSKNLPVSGSALSSENAHRLCKAIATAAAAAEPPAAASAEDQSLAAAISPDDDAPTVKRGSGSAGVGLDVSSDERRDEAVEARAPVTPVDTDLEAEARASKPARAAPKLVYVQLFGTTTWRSYCARPGVTSCHVGDPIPPGDQTTVDFLPQVPYAGGEVVADAFPFQSFDSPIKGLGAEGSYGQGYSLTTVTVSSQGSTSPSSQVVSTDQQYYAMALYRYFFTPFASKGEKNPLLAYAGVRVGWMARLFNVDPNAHSALPGSHRQYPALGLEGSLPLGTKLARVEGQFLYYVNPLAGADELIGYGKSTSGKGFGFQIGLAGDIWGPFGYILRFSYSSYSDLFTGQGQVWPNGGAAAETYSGLYWGATAQF